MSCNHFLISTVLTLLKVIEINILQIQLLLINYSVPFSDMQGGDHTDQGNSSLVLEQRIDCFKNVRYKYICLYIYVYTGLLKCTETH